MYGDDDYVFHPDGSVTAGQFGREVAVIDGGNIRASRFGPVIGVVEPDGTVKDGPFGKVLGVVMSDGTVKNGLFGQVVAKVTPPVHQRGALKLLLG